MRVGPHSLESVSRLAAVDGLGVTLWAGVRGEPAFGGPDVPAHRY
jgi:hypothetical protein